MERGGADLMMQLLRLDPIKRLTANDALDHPWFWTIPRPAKCAELVLFSREADE
jgi:serine/threonine-protein kinase BUR1